MTVSTTRRFAQGQKMHGPSPQVADGVATDSRVSTIEANLSALTRNVETLFETVQQSAHEQRRSNQAVQDEIRSTTNALAKEIAAQSRTNYPMVMALLGGLAIAVTILIAFGNLQAGNIEEGIKRVAREQAAVDAVLSDHLRLQGHAGAERGIAANAAKISHLDETLQREMRLLDADAKSRIESTDGRLAREVELISAAHGKELSSIRDDVARSLAWMDDHDQRVVGTNARQTVNDEIHAAAIESHARRLQQLEERLDYHRGQTMSGLVPRMALRDVSLPGRGLRAR